MMGFPGGISGMEPAYQCRRQKRCRIDLWVGKIPWSRKCQPTPVFLPEESHGQRKLAGYGPQGCKKLDTNEATQHSTVHIINVMIAYNQNWVSNENDRIGEQQVCFFSHFQDKDDIQAFEVEKIRIKEESNFHPTVKFKSSHTQADSC